MEWGGIEGQLVELIQKIYFFKINFKQFVLA